MMLPPNVSRSTMAAHNRGDADEMASRMDTFVAVGGFAEPISAQHAGLFIDVESGRHQ